LGAHRPAEEELGNEHARRVDPAPQAARSRVLRSLGAPRRGGRVRDVPRAHRPDGRRADRSADQHGLVPRVPPRSGEEPASEGPDHEHDVAPRSVAEVEGARGPPPRTLLRVPPMSKRKAYEFQKPQDAGPLFWKSLEGRADPDAAGERAKAEFPLGTSPV